MTEQGNPIDSIFLKQWRREGGIFGSIARLVLNPAHIDTEFLFQGFYHQLGFWSSPVWRAASDEKWKSGLARQIRTIAYPFQRRATNRIPTVFRCHVVGSAPQNDDSLYPLQLH